MDLKSIVAADGVDDERLGKVAAVALRPHKRFEGPVVGAVIRGAEHVPTEGNPCAAEWSADIAIDARDRASTEQEYDAQHDDQQSQRLAVGMV